MRHNETQRSHAIHMLGIKLLVTMALLSVLLATGAVRPRPADAAQEKSAALAVTIDNFSFAPMELEIPAGTQVTWINKDDVPHTVVSIDHKLFKSRALDTDEKFSFTFTTPGTYEYFCSVHPKMTGKIIVK